MPDDLQRLLTGNIDTEEYVRRLNARVAEKRLPEPMTDDERVFWERLAFTLWALAFMLAAVELILGYLPTG